MLERIVHERLSAITFALAAAGDLDGLKTFLGQLERETLLDFISYSMVGGAEVGALVDPEYDELLRANNDQLLKWALEGDDADTI